jgi:hypothetical protein
VRFVGEYETNLSLEILNAAYIQNKEGKTLDQSSLQSEFDQEILDLQAELLAYQFHPKRHASIYDIG